MESREYENILWLFLQILYFSLTSSSKVCLFFFKTLWRIFLFSTVGRRKETFTIQAELAALNNRKCITDRCHACHGPNKRVSATAIYVVHSLDTHTCWLGPRPLPDDKRTCLRNSKEKNADFFSCLFFYWFSKRISLLMPWSYFQDVLWKVEFFYQCVKSQSFMQNEVLCWL